MLTYRLKLSSIGRIIDFIMINVLFSPFVDNYIKQPSRGNTKHVSKSSTLSSTMSLQPLPYPLRPGSPPTVLTPPDNPQDIILEGGNIWTGSYFSIWEEVRPSQRKTDGSPWTLNPSQSKTVTRENTKIL